MDSHFPPEHIKKATKQKGFIVYDYISLSELILTVQRDYLSIISQLNIPLAIITVVLGFISFDSGNFTILVGGLLFVYLIIFAILLFQLFKKTVYFFYAKSVVFTADKFLLGNSIFSYSEEINVHKKLLFYEDLFEEYLTKPSKIQQVILEKRKTVLQGVQDVFSKGMKMTKKMDKAGPLVFGLLVVYSVTLFLFYYLGLVLGYIFFGIYSGIIYVYLFFSSSPEQRIQQKVKNIDDALSQLTTIENVLRKKTEHFSDGNITDISDFVGKKFGYFYDLIADIQNQEKELKKIIESTNHSDFFNFTVFKEYVRTEYNKPLQNMITLLDEYTQMISRQRDEIESTHSNKAEFSANIQKKLWRFEVMEKEIMKQRKNFKESLQTS